MIGEIVGRTRPRPKHLWFLLKNVGKEGLSSCPNETVVAGRRGTDLVSKSLVLYSQLLLAHFPKSYTTFQGFDYKGFRSERGRD